MKNKVILISIDGMRPDGLLQCGNPYVQELMKTSSYCLKARSAQPSVTLPCHMTMFHSVPPMRHGITTNTYVKDFPFYNENNFCIVDRDDPKFDVAFLDTPYLPVSDELLERYSPRSFVKALLPETEG